MTSRRSTAGDAGRIAITYPGQVANRDDETRPWNQYELLSLNALDSAPLFTWTTANEPADPIHWRDCGPGRCGRMFDFLDIQTSPFDGTLWATASDTCLGDCVGPSLWQPARREQR